MKLSDLSRVQPGRAVFAPINLTGPSQLMIITAEGQVIDYMEGRPIKQPPSPDAEVQWIVVGDQHKGVCQ